MLSTPRRCAARATTSSTRSARNPLSRMLVRATRPVGEHQQEELHRRAARPPPVVAMATWRHLHAQSRPFLPTPVRAPLHRPRRPAGPSRRRTRPPPLPPLPRLTRGKVNPPRVSEAVRAPRTRWRGGRHASAPPALQRGRASLSEFARHRCAPRRLRTPRRGRTAPPRRQTTPRTTRSKTSQCAGPLGPGRRLVLPRLAPGGPALPSAPPPLQQVGRLPLERVRPAWRTSR